MIDPLHKMCSADCYDALQEQHDKDLIVLSTQRSISVANVF